MGNPREGKKQGYRCYDLYRYASSHPMPDKQKAALSLAAWLSLDEKPKVMLCEIRKLSVPSSRMVWLFQFYSCGALDMTLYNA